MSEVQERSQKRHNCILPPCISEPVKQRSDAVRLSQNLKKNIYIYPVLLCSHTGRWRGNY
eukprot:1157458-Pelagomonas_calceolata.AAC.10